MAIDVLERTYSVEEYLELEKHTEVRHEYYYGKLIPMPGEKKKANIIANNILVKWRDVLLKQGYDLFSHDVKTAVDPRHIYRYPDLVAAPFSDDADEYLVFSPVFIVEVASEDSWPKDRSRKLKEYFSMPSVSHYVLVFQEEMYVELHARDGKKLAFQIFTDSNDLVEIAPLGLGISLAEIYAFVQLEAPKS